MSLVTASSLSFSDLGRRASEQYQQRGALDLIDLLFSLAPQVPGLDEVLDLLQESLGVVRLPMPGGLLDFGDAYLQVSGTVDLPFASGVHVQARAENHQGSPHLRVEAGLGQDEALELPGVSWFSVKGLRMGAYVGTTGRPGIYVGGDLSLGDLPLPVAIYPPDAYKGWQLTLREPIALPGLGSLLDFLGLDDVAALLPEGFSDREGLVIDHLAAEFSWTRRTVGALSIGLATDGPWQITDELRVERARLYLSVDDPLTRTSRAYAGYFSADLVAGNDRIPLRFNLPVGSSPLDCALDALAGVALPGPGDLLALVGAETLLPPSLASLRDITLTDLYAATAPGGKGLASFRAGIASTATWTVPGLDDWSVRDVQLSIAMDKPPGATQRSYEGSIGGTLRFLQYDLLLEGRFGSGFEVQATLSELPLTALLDTYLAEVPFPDDLRSLHLRDLVLLASPGTGAFSIAGVVAFDLSIFDRALTLDARLSLQIARDSTGKRSYTGTLEGRVQIDDDNLLIAGFEIDPDDRTLFGIWKRVDETGFSFGDMLDKLGLDGDSIPGEIDPEVSQVGFAFDARDLTINLMAVSPDVGTVFYLSQKSTTGTKAHVLGIEFPEGRTLADLPGIGSELDALDFLSFKRMSLIFASQPIAGLALPDLPVYFAENMPASLGAPAAPPLGTTLPAAGATPVTGLSSANQPLQLRQGLNFVSVLSFDENDSPLLKTLQSTTGVDEVLVQTIFGPGGVSLRAVIQEGLEFAVGSEQLTFANAYIELTLGAALGVKLGGSLGVSFLDQLLIASGGMALSVTEASAFMGVKAVETTPDGSTTRAATGNLLAPLGIRNVALNEINFLIGATFAPPGVKTGFSIAFALPQQAPGSNKMTVLLQVIPAVPVPVVNVLVLSFDVARMDIGTVMRTFSEAEIPAALQAAGLTAVEATDLGFYYCSAPTTLPDGSTAFPGFGFNGNIGLFGFKARAMLQIDLRSGIEGHFQMNPLTVSVSGQPIVSITGKGERIIEKQWRKPDEVVWKKVSNERLTATGEEEHIETRDYELVAAGGPVLKFNTTGPRFLFASIDVVLFDFARQTIEAEIGATGFSFFFNTELGKANRLTLVCRLLMEDKENGRTGFYASANFDLDLDIDIDMPAIGDLDIGSFRLDTTLRATLEIEATGEHFLLRVDGDFDFEGQTIDFPTLAFTVPVRTLRDLPERIAEQIQDFAEDLFGDIWGGLEQAWEEVEQFVEETYAEVAEEAAELADKALEQGEAAVEEARKVVEQVDEVAEDIGREAGQAVETGKKLAEDGAEAVVKIAGEAKEQAEVLARETAEFVQDVGKKVEELAEDTAAFVQDVGRDIEQIANQAAAEVRRLFNEASAVVGEIAGQASKYAQEVLREAKAIADSLNRTAKQLEDAAKKIWNDIKKAAEKVANAAKKGWKKVKKLF